jgi:mRNA interferase RelE/StbE
MHSEIYWRLERAVDALAGNPRPLGCMKMAGSANQWRIRVGDYRVIYAIDDNAQEVTILRVGHRRHVYRR